ncbi:MAG TPA: hypothetical protein VGC50_10555 [Gammaproteobacteria bacterium]
MLPAIERRVVEVVDRLLLERGELDPLDCLIALGLRRQTDALGPSGDTEIISTLLAPVGEAVALLEQAHAYATAQGLVVVARAPARSVGALPRDEASRRLIELCDSILRHSEDTRRQADLFHDSTQTVALNGLKEALAEHRTQAARLALQRWSVLTPDTQAIEDYTRLLQVLAAPRAPPAEFSRELELTITPLAWRCLGPRAREYLSPLWSELAVAMVGTAFAPATPRAHASYARAQAQQWSAVMTSVEAESDWPRHAALVVRLAEARARQGEDATARRLWAQLCWDHAQEAPAILAEAPGDPVIARLWRKFVDADAKLAVGDFPAWLLLGDSHQAHFVPGECAPDNAEGLAYAALHRVVTSGGDIAARIALRTLRPDLLRLYLAAKDFGRG